MLLTTYQITNALDKVLKEHKTKNVCFTIADDSSLLDKFDNAFLLYCLDTGKSGLCWTYKSNLDIAGVSVVNRAIKRLEKVFNKKHGKLFYKNKEIASLYKYRIDKIKINYHKHHNKGVNYINSFTTSDVYKKRLLLGEILINNLNIKEYVNTLNFDTYFLKVWLGCHTKNKKEFKNKLKFLQYMLFEKTEKPAESWSIYKPIDPDFYSVGTEEIRIIPETWDYNDDHKILLTNVKNILPNSYNNCKKVFNNLYKEGEVNKNLLRTAEYKIYEVLYTKPSHYYFNNNIFVIEDNEIKIREHKTCITTKGLAYTKSLHKLISALGGTPEDYISLGIKLYDAENENNQIIIPERYEKQKQNKIKLTSVEANKFYAFGLINSNGEEEEVDENLYSEAINSNFFNKVRNIYLERGTTTLIDIFTNINDQRSLRYLNKLIKLGIIPDYEKDDNYFSFEEMLGKDDISEEEEILEEIMNSMEAEDDLISETEHQLEESADTYEEDSEDSEEFEEEDEE